MKCKRVFDIAASLLAIVVLLPVFTVIAVAIKLSSKEPVIFKQERAGGEVVNLPLHPRLGNRADEKTVNFITHYVEVSD
jgi:hypothetical protein